MNDFRMFDSYRKEWTRNNGGKAYCSVDHLLRFWRQNKGEYLAPLFGDNLILEKDIVYDKPHDQLRSEMYRVLECYDSFCNKVVKKLAKVLDVDEGGWYNEETDGEIVWRALRHCICNAGALTDNKLELGYKGYDAEGQPKWINAYTMDFGNGKKVQVQRGMKITRAFTQICKALDMSDEWEEFRIQHSQVLNTKRMTGTLCLSIHPLDYATASDNDNGWSSCMSWNDYGCYRMGTVEMMNSPMVICAYLKSKKQHMEIAGEEWNSKKWRAWVIVTKDVILVNRHYPYHQDEMAINCINWVRDLVKEKYGWLYEDPHTDFYRWMRNVGYEIEFHTNYMYNDLGGDDVIGCFRLNWRPINMPGVINFSGPAECMICGDEIYPDDQDAGQLECNDCWTEFRCSECGESLNEDDVYHDPDGQCLCYDCYERICYTCGICDDTCYKDDQITVQFPVHHDGLAKWKDVFGRKRGSNSDNYNPDFQWMFDHAEGQTLELNICDHCARRYDVQELEYTEEDKGVTPDEYTVFNPNKISMEKAFSLLNAPGWEYANYAYKRLSEDRFFHTSNIEDAKVYYKAIVDFWTEQWARFQEDFDKADEDTDR